MTALDWQRDRTRKRMLEAAAMRLPNPVRAAYDGQCPTCLRPYHRGDRIAKAPNGWAHLPCTIPSR